MRRNIGRVALAVLFLLGGSHSVLAAGSLASCGQETNFACASGTPTTQTVNTQWLFSGANVGATPMVFDGATADSNKTSLAITDPTGTRTVTFPDANTATGQAVACSAGNHVSAFSATTGAFTCSSDTAPNHNLLSSTHTDTVTHTPVRGDVIVANSTPAWAAVAIGSANKFLHTNGTDAAWASIAAADVGAGTLANVLTWNESLTVSAGTATLANSPRVSTGATPTVLLISNGIGMQPVSSCSGNGVNQYTISGTTITPCDTTNNATFLAFYER